jgi:hypothetical protein
MKQNKDFGFSDSCMQKPSSLILVVIIMEKSTQTTQSFTLENKNI